MQDILDRFLNCRIRKVDNKHGVNKPLVLLFALRRCYLGQPRLAQFILYERKIRELEQTFGKINVVYPFGRLVHDRIWEIQSKVNLFRNISGDLVRSELVNSEVYGGLRIEIYERLIDDQESCLEIADLMLRKFFSSNDRIQVIRWLKLPLSTGENSAYYEESTTVNEMGMNLFVNYLNSLSNVKSSGLYALAESQALSPFFGDLYEPFPMAQDLVEVIEDSEDRVIILTGHAGDGKSTVALDILRNLRRLPPSTVLDQPVKDLEEAQTLGGRPVYIVKDMSELSISERVKRLKRAFSTPGKWLIVSNTGPLLQALLKYSAGVGDKGLDESLILRALETPVRKRALEDCKVHDRLGKPLWIINLTLVENSDLGAKILGRLVRHPAWRNCDQCGVEKSCPIRQNRQALLAALPHLEERVRWIYQRMHAYERRLTLRQMVSQLSNAVTGGLSCEEVHYAGPNTSEGSQEATLEKMLFSQLFFGDKGIQTDNALVNGLIAVKLARKIPFGDPGGAGFQRALINEPGAGWATLPSELNRLARRWIRLAGSSDGVPWRQALRRMAFFFGATREGGENRARLFFDTFLRSPSLRAYDTWRIAGNFQLSQTEIQRLRDLCLEVLLEYFSGFAATQFRDQRKLILTLRRPDRMVIQTTQMVQAAFDFDDFELSYDARRGSPELLYTRSPDVHLSLGLPLLDYIKRRYSGQIGGVLGRIYQAQLDGFRSKLLSASNKVAGGENRIELLFAGIDGRVMSRRYLIDRERGRLECM